MPPYRDSLCALITRIVENVEIAGDETMVITFDDGTRLTIPLHSYKGAGERAIFTAPKMSLSFGNK